MDNNNKRVPRPELWLAWANVLSFVALSLLMFRLQAPVTFYRFDGTFLLTLAGNQADWLPSLTAFNADMSKGNGGLWFPTQTRVIPGFVVGLFGSDDWYPALAMTWFAGEFAVATVLVGRTLGMSLPVIVLGCWLGLLGALPYLVPTPAIERLWGNPHFLTAIAWTAVAFCIFVKTGRRSLAGTVAAGATILAILVYLTVSQPMVSVVFVTVLGFFGVAALTLVSDRRELWHKLFVGALVIAVYVTLFAPYLIGLFLYAKTTFFWSELYPVSVSWRWASFLAEDPRRPIGPVFLIVAFLGGATAAVTAARPLRDVARAYLVFVALLWTVTSILVLTGTDWRGPSISYFDLFVYPFHSLFAAFFLYACVSRLGTVACHTRLRRAALLFALVVPWGVLPLWEAPNQKPLLKNQIPFQWPPLRTPVVDLLQDKIRLKAGEPFRGLTANLAGSAFEPHWVHVPFVNQHNYDAMILFYLGNDHRGYGLWYYDIPTLDDANNFTSPFWHLVIARLLNDRGALFTRPHTTASRFAPAVLEQLGVRYVITEEPLVDRTPVLTIDVVASRRQYLYELSNPNLSGRSVERVFVAKNASEAISHLAAPDMNFAQEAVLFESLPPGPLVPATSKRLDVHRGHRSLSAESPSRSLLVLPVAFSRCLRFTWTSPGPETPLVLRANLSQTGILFTGRIEGRVDLRFGPFEQRTCRLRDYLDAQAHELAGAALPYMPRKPVQSTGADKPAYEIPRHEQNAAE